MQAHWLTLPDAIMINMRLPDEGMQADHKK